VLLLMMGMGGKLVLTGLAVGLAGSLLLGRYLRSEVFSVPVTDPITIAGAVILLASTGFLACLAPARRATRLEPMSALRHDLTGLLDCPNVIPLTTASKVISF